MIVYRYGKESSSQTNQICIGHCIKSPQDWKLSGERLVGRIAQKSSLISAILLPAKVLENVEMSNFVDFLASNHPHTQFASDKSAVEFHSRMSMSIKNRALVIQPSLYYCFLYTCLGISKTANNHIRVLGGSHVHSLGYRAAWLVWTAYCGCVRFLVQLKPYGFQWMACHFRMVGYAQSQRINGD